MLVGDSCSGVLVHPRVLLYASHCGTAIQEAFVRAERLVPHYCEAFPSDGVIAKDLAYCVLSSPAESGDAVSPATGCEDSWVQPGTTLTIKGRGFPAFQQVEAAVTVLERGDAILAAGEGVGACAGDSGGPALVDLHTENSPVGVRRLVGVISHGAAGCEEGQIWITPLAPLVPWLELRTGLDLTPCGDADGTWDPGPDCRARAVADSSSAGTPWDFCGKPVSLPTPSDASPPVVTLSVSERRELSGSFELVPSVEATDEGWGVREVTLTVEGDVEVPEFARSLRPYNFPALQLEPGRYRLVASAVDYAGNSSSESIDLILELDAREPSCQLERGTTPKRSGMYSLALGILLARVLRRPWRPGRRPLRRGHRQVATPRGKTDSGAPTSAKARTTSNNRRNPCDDIC